MSVLGAPDAVVSVSTDSPSQLHGDLHPSVSVRTYDPPVVCQCVSAFDAARPRAELGGGETKACAAGSRMVRHLVLLNRNHILLSCRVEGLIKKTYHVSYHAVRR